MKINILTSKFHSLLSLSFRKTTNKKVSDEEELQFLLEWDEDDNVQADGPASNGRDVILTRNTIRHNFVCLVKPREVDLCILFTEVKTEWRRRRNDSSLFGCYVAT